MLYFYILFYITATLIIRYFYYISVSFSQMLSSLFIQYYFADPFWRNLPQSASFSLLLFTSFSEIIARMLIIHVLTMRLSFGNRYSNGVANSLSKMSVVKDSSNDDDKSLLAPCATRFRGANRFRWNFTNNSCNYQSISYMISIIIIYCVYIS